MLIERFNSVELKSPGRLGRARLFDARATATTKGGDGKVRERQRFDLMIWHLVIMPIRLREMPMATIDI